MSGRIQIPGRLAFAVTFDKVPSVNEYIKEAGRSPVHAGMFEKKWRVVGHRTLETHLGNKGLVACRRADGTTGIRLKEPALAGNIYVRWIVYRPDFAPGGTMKVKDSAFNLYTKPVEDGFTDAGLWPGDDDRYILGRVVEVDKGAAHVACDVFVA